MVVIVPVVAWYSQETGTSITRIPILTMTQLIYSISPHTMRYRHIRVNFVAVLTKDLSVKPETRLSMNSFLVTIRTLEMTNIHIIHQISHNNHIVVSTVEVHTSALIVKQGIHFLITITTIRIMTNLHSAK